MSSIFIIDTYIISSSSSSSSSSSTRPDQPREATPVGGPLMSDPIRSLLYKSEKGEVPAHDGCISLDKKHGWRKERGGERPPSRRQQTLKALEERTQAAALAPFFPSASGLSRTAEGLAAGNVTQKATCIVSLQVRTYGRHLRIERAVHAQRMKHVKYTKYVTRQDA